MKKSFDSVETLGGIYYVAYCNYAGVKYCKALWLNKLLSSGHNLKNLLNKAIV